MKIMVLNLFKDCEYAGSRSAHVSTVDISQGEIYLPLEKIASSRVIRAIISCSAYK
jgi:hypothetical protein